jgi:hypothetical protein
VDLSPLSTVAFIRTPFLEGCFGRDLVVIKPPLCNPPKGWIGVAKTKQWKRVTWPSCVCM